MEVLDGLRSVALTETKVEAAHLVERHLELPQDEVDVGNVEPVRAHRSSPEHPLVEVMLRSHSAEGGDLAELALQELDVHHIRPRQLSAAVLPCQSPSRVPARCVRRRACGPSIER